MSIIQLDLSDKKLKGEIELPFSKSLFNRALIIKALFPTLSLPKVPNVEDVEVLYQALQCKKGRIDLGPAGTAMRFATAFFAVREGAEVELTGSNRMFERPIGELVDALKSIGAQIEYTGQKGFPPIKIKGAKLSGGHVVMNAQTSSQFATAMLLIAPAFSKGLTLDFKGEVVSRSYVEMTISLMRKLGFDINQDNNTVEVKYMKDLPSCNYLPERDWSAAAFWYGLVASGAEAAIKLKGVFTDSLQGDKRVSHIFQELGVRTTFLNDGVLLEKGSSHLPRKLVVNLQDNPDLAQPISATCAALGIGADLRGLQTLPLKETDRLKALKTELRKIGVNARITANSISFQPTAIHQSKEPFNSYKDHRMAMSLAILSTQFPVEIFDPEVVAKSYPTFWSDIAKMSTIA